MYYSGNFTPTHPEKYKGDIKEIKFRSSWELAAFIWLDTNEGVKEWASESTIINYKCKTDGRIHRYFVDLCVTFTNNMTYLFEIKPKNQTLPPKPRKRKTKKYITEVMTYVRNVSKWEAARQYAEERKMIFMLLTEDELRKFGVKII